MKNTKNLKELIIPTDAELRAAIASPEPSEALAGPRVQEAQQIGSIAVQHEGEAEPVEVRTAA